MEANILEPLYSRQATIEEGLSHTIHHIMVTPLLFEL